MTLKLNGCTGVADPGRVRHQQYRRAAVSDALQQERIAYLRNA